MITALSIPEITILPVTQDEESVTAHQFTWHMKAYEESEMDSYDHGDTFDSVEEALAHAYSVYYRMAHKRHLVPAKEKQEFKVTIAQCVFSESLGVPVLDRTLRIV